MALELSLETKVRPAAPSGAVCRLGRIGFTSDWFYPGFTPSRRRNIERGKLIPKSIVMTSIQSQKHQKPLIISLIASPFSTAFLSKIYPSCFQSFQQLINSLSYPCIPSLHSSSLQPTLSLSRVPTFQELRVEESIQRAFFQENREFSTLFWGNRFFSEWLETALKCSF